MSNLKNKIKFLKDNNCYREFVQGVINHTSHPNIKNEDCVLWYMTNNNRDMIIRAFSWYDSDNKHVDWFYIHNLYVSNYANITG